MNDKDNQTLRQLIGFLELLCVCGKKALLNYDKADCEKWLSLLNKLNP
jgi:hypothetical protein